MGRLVAGSPPTYSQIGVLGNGVAMWTLVDNYPTKTCGVQGTVKATMFEAQVSFARLSGTAA